MYHVISIVLVLVMMVSLVNVNTVSAKTENDIVIRYFSATGTTEGAAKKIKKAVKKADIVYIGYDGSIIGLN